VIQCNFSKKTPRAGWGEMAKIWNSYGGKGFHLEDCHLEDWTDLWESYKIWREIFMIVFIFEKSDRLRVKKLFCIKNRPPFSDKLEREG
jgi:hypothetical protein